MDQQTPISPSSVKLPGGSFVHHGLGVQRSLRGKFKKGGFK